MITCFAHFLPFSDDSDRKVSGLLTEVPAWFRNDSVAVVSGGFEHFDLGLAELRSRVSAS